MTKSGCFYGVGLGPGDPELVTLKAWRILQRVARIYAVASRQGERSVSEAIVAALPGVAAPVTRLVFAMNCDAADRRRTVAEHAATIAAALREGLDCAFVTIGDPMTYSTCSYLLRELRRALPELAAEIVPGVNSWSLLAARAQTPLVEDRGILEIVPSYRLDAASAAPRTTVYLKTYHTRNAILDAVPDSSPVLYGENLGLDGENVTADLTAARKLPETYLSLLAVKTPRGEA